MTPTDGFRNPRMLQIIQAVAEEFELSPAILTGKTQVRDAAEPRHIAMLLCQRATLRSGKGMSLSRIGRAFGGRHNTTVLYGIQHASLLESQPNIAAVIGRITQRIEREGPPAGFVRKKKAEEWLESIDTKLGELLELLKGDKCPVID